MMPQDFMRPQVFVVKPIEHCIDFVAASNQSCREHDRTRTIASRLKFVGALIFENRISFQYHRGMQAKMTVRVIYTKLCLIFLEF